MTSGRTGSIALSLKITSLVEISHVVADRIDAVGDLMRAIEDTH
jgi:hypothetical protein